MLNISREKGWCEFWMPVLRFVLCFLFLYLRPHVLTGICFNIHNDENLSINLPITEVFYCVDAVGIFFSYEVASNSMSVSDYGDAFSQRYWHSFLRFITYMQALVRWLIGWSFLSAKVLKQWRRVLQNVHLPLCLRTRKSQKPSGCYNLWSQEVSSLSVPKVRT